MGEQGIISCCDCIPCKINGKFTSTCHKTEGSCRNAGGTPDGSERGRVNPGGAGCVEVSGNESSFSAGDSTPENFVRNCWGPVHGEVSGCPGMGFDKNIPMHFNGDHWATEWFPIAAIMNILKVVKQTLLQMITTRHSCVLTLFLIIH